jgi:hypothetical protein
MLTKTRSNTLLRPYISDAAPMIVDEMNCKNENKEPINPPNKTAFILFVELSSKFWSVLLIESV